MNSNSTGLRVYRLDVKPDLLNLVTNFIEFAVYFTG